MKKLIILFAAFSFSMTALSCAKKNDASGPITIGGIFPLSGPVAVYGVEARNGIELAIEEINTAGGINGRTISIVSEDDEGNPEKTVNAYTKLVTRDKVGIIIGSLTSGCTMAMTERAQHQGVLLLAPAATMETITNAGDYIFRACFIDPFQGTVGGLFAADTLNAKRAAILYDNGNDYSLGLYENFAKAFISKGGEVVAREAYGTGEVDFNAQLTKIKNAEPDVVYLPDYYSTVSLIAKQLRAQGINTPVVGADGWDGLTENAGDEVLNGFYSNHYAADSTDPKVQNFVASYKNKFGTEPVSFAALGYDSMYLIRDAIQRAGSSESKAVRDALAQTQGSYVTGNLTFDEKRNPVKSAVIVELVKKDGKLSTVYKTTVNP
ncbi:MAG: ABC transporter substrate-binding protein [Spirochaetaceae bacterium]|jgi:branched-chain amino acid transport system substrate-binding protein|nr:ABC transporter substrate-binding protein [Spirochaetaceae bacterium]GMO30033.1 MAG: ABC transporter substrate-binding protein [Termitinemataceae bacterium]